VAEYHVPPLSGFSGHPRFIFPPLPLDYSGVLWGDRVNTVWMRVSAHIRAFTEYDRVSKDAQVTLTEMNASACISKAFALSHE